jgi:hypothetical protein
VLRLARKKEGIPIARPEDSFPVIPALLREEIFEALLRWVAVEVPAISCGDAPLPQSLAKRARN